jgi:DNA polymerase-3 subunit epsilon
MGLDNLHELGQRVGRWHRSQRAARHSI